MKKIPIDHQIRDLGLPSLPTSAVRKTEPRLVPEPEKKTKTDSYTSRDQTIKSLSQAIKSYSSAEIDQILCQTDAAKRELVLESLLTRAKGHI